MSRFEPLTHDSFPKLYHKVRFFSFILFNMALILDLSLFLFYFTTFLA